MDFSVSIAILNIINIDMIFDIVLDSGITKYRGVAQLVERWSPKP